MTQSLIFIIFCISVNKHYLPYKTSIPFSSTLTILILTILLLLLLLHLAQCSGNVGVEAPQLPGAVVLILEANQVDFRKGQAGAQLLRHHDVVGEQQALEAQPQLAEVACVPSLELLPLPDLLLGPAAHGVLLGGMQTQPLRPLSVLKDVHGVVHGRLCKHQR